MIRRSMDLNADVGEDYDDEPLLPLVSSVNIACGAHAGDEDTMRETVARAHALDLSIGAHPGYADRASFGRVPMSLPLDEVEALVRTQMIALATVAAERGARLSHVKPHGALYNQSAADEALAAAIARAVRDVDPSLRLVGLAGSASTRRARDMGLAVLEEAFADRRYMHDGSLAPRGVDGAVIGDASDAAGQALALASGEPVRTIDGTTLVVRADTICLHGDSPGAVENARAVRERLEAAGIDVAAPR